MAALPSPTQVAGTHSSIYEAYYHQVDPNGTGAIQALDAARFLKKSRLSDVVLSKIWDLSDPTGKGYLDKAGLFVALKLVALAQAGKDINMSNIHSETPPPKVVKGVLMESKLPLETLGKIWDLADQDKDGMLDRHEFIVGAVRHGERGQAVPGAVRGGHVPGATRAAGRSAPGLAAPGAARPAHSAAAAAGEYARTHPQSDYVSRD
ncbi:jg9648 [Pararge aegeria aegeria]|uniref:Jg9648 protein n=1 Tax=Pararge aegeria aegeria TaxID=348720 RepID=A0A8S4RSQ7_9NEOP|nr:jg9648 [Pararge aegeria aegeria]